MLTKTSTTINFIANVSSAAAAAKNINTGCDPNKEFDCDDGTCIHESLKCDGQVNCKYRYDEASDPGPCLGKLRAHSLLSVSRLAEMLSLTTLALAPALTSRRAAIERGRRRVGSSARRRPRKDRNPVRVSASPQWLARIDSVSLPWSGGREQRERESGPTDDERQRRRRRETELGLGFVI